MEAEAVTMARISAPRRNDQSAEGRSCMALTASSTPRAATEPARAGSVTMAARDGDG